jgi:hypothetical protein
VIASDTIAPLQPFQPQSDTASFRLDYFQVHVFADMPLSSKTHFSIEPFVYIAERFSHRRRTQPLTFPAVFLQIHI